jgi:hypothetical protein
MNASVKTAGGPPKFLGALASGFNLVANKAYLLLLPIALDLLLWFGPHFSLKTLLGPALIDLYTMPGAGPNESAMLETMRRLVDLTLNRYNLLSQLSGIPIGVPSLMTGILPVDNPLGKPLTIEVAGTAQALSGWLLFALLGLVLGSFYFGAVARASASPGERISFQNSIWQTGQTLFLTLLLLVLLAALSIPIIIVTFVIALISPALAQVALFFSGFLILWVFIPLVFSPHGIFAAGLNAFRAMLVSMRLMRALFPGVGLFLLSAIILAQGLGMLWRLAPESSWLMLAGVFGNAFTGTGLLAASFIYYRGAAAWATQNHK